MQTNLWLNRKFSKQYSERSADKKQDWEEFEITFPSMLELMPASKDMIVLDYGCGSADYTATLASIYKTVIGTDISLPMIEISRERHPDIKTFVWSIDDGEFPENIKFDVVFSKLVIHFIKDLSIFAKVMSGLLKKNGTIIVSTTHPDYSRKETGQYFQVMQYEREILGMKDKMSFVHRDFQEYIEPFLDNGFVLTGIKEPLVSKTITDKYQIRRAKMNMPRRLILRFQKTK